MAILMKMNPFYVGNSQFPYRRFEGGPGSKDTKYVEATTPLQTWKAGDLIFMDDANNCTICADDGTILTGPIAGQAVSNAKGVAGEKVFFAVIRPHDRFIGNVYHTTETSAVTAKTQIGDVLPMRHASSRWMVDIQTVAEDTDSADAVVKVLGFPLWHPLLNQSIAIGDQFGLVEFEFLEFSAATDFIPFTRRLQFA